MSVQFADLSSDFAALPKDVKSFVEHNIRCSSFKGADFLPQIAEIYKIQLPSQTSKASI